MGQTKFRKWRAQKGKRNRDMTVDFIRTAQDARVNALTEIENRDLENGGSRKVHRLPPLTQRHIDALFQTSTEAKLNKTGPLAA